jgi:hypothetical protein
MRGKPSPVELKSCGYKGESSAKSLIGNRKKKTEKRISLKGALDAKT